MIQGLHAANISPHAALQGWNRVAGPDSAEAFKNLLVDSLRELNAGQCPAEAAGTAPTSATSRPAEGVSALCQTDVSLGVMMQIQDRLLSAYHEVQNIRV